MKVVINTCFGGFGLSPKAIKRLAELNGKECYFYEDSYIDGKSVYTKMEEEPDGLFFSSFTIGDVREVNSILSKDWSSMSDEEIACTKILDFLVRLNNLTKLLS